MHLAREIGDGIGDQERLDVALERIAHGHQATDVREHAANDQLIALSRAQQRLEIRALERAVAVLRQHDVAGLRAQALDDRR